MFRSDFNLKIEGGKSGGSCEIKLVKTLFPDKDDSNYNPFLLPNYLFGYEKELQSCKPTFLGVRSPNPLPKTSGLGNLTILFYTLY